MGLYPTGLCIAQTSSSEASKPLKWQHTDKAFTEYKQGLYANESYQAGKGDDWGKWQVPGRLCARSDRRRYVNMVVTAPMGLYDAYPLVVHWVDPFVNRDLEWRLARRGPLNNKQGGKNDFNSELLKMRYRVFRTDFGVPIAMGELNSMRLGATATKTMYAGSGLHFLKLWATALYDTYPACTSYSDPTPCVLDVLTLDPTNDAKVLDAVFPGRIQKMADPDNTLKKCQVDLSWSAPRANYKDPNKMPHIVPSRGFGYVSGKDQPDAPWKECKDCDPEHPDVKLDIIRTCNLKKKTCSIGRCNLKDAQWAG